MEGSKIAGGKIDVLLNKQDKSFYQPSNGHHKHTVLGYR